MEQYQNNFDDIQALINVLPEKIAEVINENGNLEKLIEVVMDVGRIPLARYTNGDLPLSAEEVTYENIDSVVEKIGTFDLDNRAGIHALVCIGLPCISLSRISIAGRGNNRLNAPVICNLNQRNRLGISTKDQQFLAFKFALHFLILSNALCVISKLIHFTLLHNQYR